MKSVLELSDFISDVTTPEPVAVQVSANYYTGGPPIVTSIQLIPESKETVVEDNEGLGDSRQGFGIVNYNNGRRSR